jgi:hypothetical protein
VAGDRLRESVLVAAVGDDDVFTNISLSRGLSRHSGRALAPRRTQDRLGNQRGTRSSPDAGWAPPAPDSACYICRAAIAVSSTSTLRVIAVREKRSRAHSDRASRDLGGWRSERLRLSTAPSPPAVEPEGDDAPEARRVAGAPGRPPRRVRLSCRDREGKAPTTRPPLERGAGRARSPRG